MRIWMEEQAGERDHFAAKITLSLVGLVAAVIALPCGFGLMALGGPIMEVIALGNVDTGIAGPILSILGIASCFTRKEAA